MRRGEADNSFLVQWTLPVPPRIDPMRQATHHSPILSGDEHLRRRPRPTPLPLRRRLPRARHKRRRGTCTGCCAGGWRRRSITASRRSTTSQTCCATLTSGSNQRIPSSPTASASSPSTFRSSVYRHLQLCSMRRGRFIALPAAPARGLEAAFATQPPFLRKCFRAEF